MIRLLLPLMLVTVFLVLYPFKSAASMGGESRSGHYTCTLDLALRANDASASIVSGTTRALDEATSAEPKSEPKAEPKHHHANLIGRGLANCVNQHGFEFNLPAVMAVSLNSAKELPIDSLRASMAPISVNRDVNMIFDKYAPHVELRETPTAGTYSSAERQIIVKGLKNDVLLQVNLSVPASFSSKVNVSQVELKLDNDSEQPKGSRKPIRTE